ncbi:MAG: hypothetical protein R2695_18445 [Acidimicrobiales bacterium]
MSWTLRSTYEWAQHAVVARQLGMTEGDLERVRRGPQDPAWSPFEAAVLAVTDGLLADGHVDDELWNVLAERLDEAALMDLVFTVGGYATLAMLFNAADLPLDPDLDPADIADFPDPPR